MNVTALRSLTTGKLHGDISEVYGSFEYLLGESGIMTHQLPNALTAVRPILKARDYDESFWDGEYDALATGEVKVSPLTEEEQKQFWETYAELPNPLFGN